MKEFLNSNRGIIYLNRIYYIACSVSKKSSFVNSTRMFRRLSTLNQHTDIYICLYSSILSRSTTCSLSLKRGAERRTKYSICLENAEYYLRHRRLSIGADATMWSHVSPGGQHVCNPAFLYAYTYPSRPRSNRATKLCHCPRVYHVKFSSCFFKLHLPADVTRAWQGT